MYYQERLDECECEELFQLANPTLHEDVSSSSLIEKKRTRSVSPKSKSSRSVSPVRMSTRDKQKKRQTEIMHERHLTMRNFMARESTNQISIRKERVQDRMIKIWDEMTQTRLELLELDDEAEDLKKSNSSYKVERVMM